MYLRVQLYGTKYEVINGEQIEIVVNRYNYHVIEESNRFIISSNN